MAPGLRRRRTSRGTEESGQVAGSGQVVRPAEPGSSCLSSPGARAERQCHHTRSYILHWDVVRASGEHRSLRETGRPGFGFRAVTNCSSLLTTGVLSVSVEGHWAGWPLTVVSLWIINVSRLPFSGGCEWVHVSVKQEGGESMRI